MKPLYLFSAALLLSASSILSATMYYVDSKMGQDTNDGISASRPWKTLDKVNRSRFAPGDRVLFHAGRRWEGELTLSSSGKEGEPIQIDCYGSGALPRIDGNGQVENTLKLENVEYAEVRHLELTNHGAAPALRRAVLIVVSNFGVAHHLVVSDLYIHDVNGTNERKDTGGILFRTIGDAKPSRFDGLTIERNIIWRVDRSGISAESNQFARTKWFPSLHVVLRDNYADDLGGDGIVPWATDGAVVEHNIVLHANSRAGSYNAGIWPWSTDNSLFQLNEAAYTHTTRDGEGFDSDYNSRNTHFLYNYSHDNDGGFMLICTPVKRDTNENVGNTGTVIRYNISRNDHERVFHLSGADDTLVADNAIYVGSKDNVQIVLVSNWDGWSKGATFRNNTIDVAGTGRYGHEVGRNANGRYEIAPGWGGARDIHFEGNKYFGNNLDLPADTTGVVDPNYHPEHLDWDEPVFDPSHPEQFSSYLVRHRSWMLRLFASQFGAIPQLQGAGESSAGGGNKRK